MPEPTERFELLDRLAAPDLWPEIRLREPRRPQPREGRTLHRMVLVATVVALAAGAIGFAVVAFRGHPSPAPATPTGLSGEVTFLVSEDGGTHLYATDVATGGSRRISSARAFGPTVSWSPDGSLLVTAPSLSEGRTGLAILREDGTLVRTLSVDPLVLPSDPVWSPDGTRIAFVAGGAIYEIDPDGRGFTQLIAGDPTDAACRLAFPAWAPDSRALAFIRECRPTVGQDSIEVLHPGSDATLVRYAGVSAAGLSWSPDGRSMVFCVRTPGTGAPQVAVMRADGSDLRVLTHGPNSGFDPVWSPDGRSIAFTLGRRRLGGALHALAVIRADGSGLMVLSGKTIYAGPPAWRSVRARPSLGPIDVPSGEVVVSRTQGSNVELFAVDPATGSSRKLSSLAGFGSSVSPDGRRIAVSRGLGSGIGEIVVANIDGSSRRKLPIDELLDPQDLRWSPDGRLIAFASTYGDIYVIDPSGGGPRRVLGSGNPCWYGDLAWSPDGMRLGFVAECATGPHSDYTYAIETIGLDGAGRTRVVDLGTADATASPVAWSPDGSRFAFTVNRDGNRDVWTVRADGGGLTRLTNDPDDEYGPVWSPDSRWIAFVGAAFRSGQYEVDLIEADGTNYRRLTDRFNAYALVAWLPTPPG